MVLSRQLVVAARCWLDAVLADDAAVEGEVLHAGSELVVADVGVVRGEWLEVAEPGVEVGVALDVCLPGGGDATACQLGAAVREGGLPVFGAEGGVQALAEVAADGALPCGRDVQVVEQLRGGGEFGGGLLLGVFEGDEGFGEGVVLGLQGFGFEGVVVGVGGGL